jgi:putative component of toxin-antitoxin plasmid stabilization module
MLTVREYLNESGRSPFRDWLSTLDQGIKARVQARILRFESGNLGDHKQVGAGCGRRGSRLDLATESTSARAGERSFCSCSAASTQRKDIKLAQEYWATYLKETPPGSKK